MKKFLFTITLFFIFGYFNVFAAEGDFEYLRLIKASNSSSEPFYSYLPANSNSIINIQVDSNRHSLGTEPSKVLVLHACTINFSNMKINNITNSYGYVSQQGATIYNSIEDCTFYLAGNKYFGTYQYWYFPIQSSYFNDGDGTYNLNFDVDVYNTLDTGVRFLEAYTYTKIPNSILEADTIAKQYYQQQTIIDQNQATNDKLDNLDDSITSEEPPTKLDNLSDSAGWLPAGPVDSILNLPLTMFQNLSNNIGSTCTPLVVNLPYVNENITLPCLNSIYQQIEGLSVWINSIGVIASAFILYSYLLTLYKWVDDTLTFRENNHIDNWGGI